MAVNSPQSPISIKNFILEQLCYEGTKGISFDRVFELLGEIVLVDDFYKQLLYIGLKSSENVEFLNSSNEVININDKLQFEDVKDYFIRVNIDYQFERLTGQNKQKTSIGNSPYELLVEIAKSRDQGIDSLSLTTITGQDQRSLTTRIQTLSHLIYKTQLLKNGRVLSLFIYKKFITQDLIDKYNDIKFKDDSSNFNLRGFRENLIKILKQAKSGIRQIDDLRRELEMDKNSKLKRLYKTSINYLESKNCIEKILIVSPINENKKIRALKFVKDLVITNENDHNDDNEEDEDEEDEDDEDKNDEIEEEFNDELIDDELKNLTSSTADSSIKIVSTSNSPHIPTFNRFSPIQNQIYDLINSQGIKGCSSNFIVNTIFGPNYLRPFNKIVDSFIHEKFQSQLFDQQIIRHYDSKGKLRFYRYFTRGNFEKLTNSSTSTPSSTFNNKEFNDSKPSKKTLEDLNKSEFVALSSRADVYEQNNIRKIYWRGGSDQITPEIKQLLTEQENRISKVKKQTQNKRGRPKKGELRRNIQVSKSFESTEEPLEIKPTDNKPTISIASLPPIVIAKPKLTLSDLSGNSFQTIERYQSILEVLKQLNGITVENHGFLNRLRENLGYNADKKTLKNDLNSLIEQQKIYRDSIEIKDEEKDFVVSYNLIISIDASNDDIDEFKSSLTITKTAKLSKKINLVKDVEIEFFDESFDFTKEEPPALPEVKDEKVLKSTKIKKKQNQSKKAPLKSAKPSKTKATGSAKATKFIDPLKRGFDVENELPNKRAKLSSHHSINRKRNSAQLSSEDSLLLFKSVIICKTINKNEIVWNKILEIFPQYTEAFLKGKWPGIRTMMGPNGVLKATIIFKRLILKSVKLGKITDEEVLKLDLIKLIQLWEEYENKTVHSVEAEEDLEEEEEEEEEEEYGLNDELNDYLNEKLYVDIKENYSRFKLSKSYQTAKMDQTSMVKKAIYLSSQVFTYKDDESDDSDNEDDYKLTNNEENNLSQEELEIRKIIISIVLSGENVKIDNLKILDKYSKESIDKVFLYMTKTKEIQIALENQKISIGDKLIKNLSNNLEIMDFFKISKFQSFLKDSFFNKKGFLLSPVFEDSLMIPILELISNGSLNLTKIDHLKKELFIGYEARTVDKDNLICEILLTPPEKIDSIKDKVEKTIKVPNKGFGCCYIWIDVNGEINKSIWSRLIKNVLLIIISNPGIRSDKIYENFQNLLDKNEFQLIVDWLIESKAIILGDFDGLWLLDQWYQFI
ncbi:hypothetical protein WICMUC_000930 [Wickerhamomyces mucosus]|uniref:Uncharacterized protein n=1 Tax=Wickerhamomyces mucosus TaxID=1378264 RepID=A0A9P8PXQ4_9ASCO|nr:hypothetical protein WICMUC_000930 [Wickerhamomyces mucosus]